MNRFSTLALTVTALAATALAAAPAQAAGPRICTSQFFGGEFYCGGDYERGETTLFTKDGRIAVFVIGLDHAVWFRTDETSWISLGGYLKSKVKITNKKASNIFTINATGSDDRTWSRDFNHGWSDWYTAAIPNQ